MKVIRKWQILGNDGNTYTVHEREAPGPVSRSLAGGSRTFGGTLDYVLANGDDLFDDEPGYWETPSGVLLKKPADL